MQGVDFALVGTLSGSNQYIQRALGYISSSQSLDKWRYNITWNKYTLCKREAWIYVHLSKHMYTVVADILCIYSLYIILSFFTIENILIYSFVIISHLSVVNIFLLTWHALIISNYNLLNFVTISW